ncbi:MAG: 50S ribosomal protein L32 [Parcubacteria group bacterium RIFCSPHIGHO2_01_FULL_45_26]|nr:MAG: 50S ribosomal protein L32 [Parcubacteria group bacterium RIFCSPHIGHO2_01_FULL_45_26]
MSVRMRHTSGHTRNRRSHHALSGGILGKCDNCGEVRPRHSVCLTCGKYRGRVVVDVVAKKAKKELKKKEATKAAK